MKEKSINRIDYLSYVFLIAATILFVYYEYVPSDTMLIISMSFYVVACLTSIIFSILLFVDIFRDNNQKASGKKILFHIAKIILSIIILVFAISIFLKLKKLI